MDVTRPEEQPETLQCQWCSTTASADTKRCPSCGAALTLRETIGELVIPGVTHVDPELSQYAAQPLRITGPSASQSAAGSAFSSAAIGGGPEALLALGGLAAVAVNEYLAAGRGSAGRQAAIDKVGLPSEVVLQMLDKLEREEAAQRAEQAAAGDPPDLSEQPAPDAPAG